jgi:hypothetical protein
MFGLDAAQVLVPAQPEWPVVTIHRRQDATPLESEWWGPDRVDFFVPGGGKVSIDRSRAAADFSFPAGVPADEESVHPIMASPAAVVNRWHGRDSFHAGAFVSGTGAWAVVGEKGAGKSSMLAWLATRGVPVLGDDVLVLDGDSALAGPRCIDLRSDAAARMGIGTNLGVVGLRVRWRVYTAPCPPAVPLRGWIFPAWGDAIRVRPIPAAQRIPRLLENLALVVPPVNSRSLLELAALPCVEFSRPSDWDGIDAAMEHLLEWAR